MSSQNDKEHSVHIKAAVIAGIFGIIVACIGGIFLVLVAFINNGFIFAGAGKQNPYPTTASIQNSNNQTDGSLPSLGISYGKAWQYDNAARTMTWVGITDGTEDIWQPGGEPLQKIRSGYTAIFTTTVLGEILACVLSINGENVKNSCDGVLYQVAAGTYQITSANNDAGGFRWCPLVGYGWRSNGGVCK